MSGFSTLIDPEDQCSQRFATMPDDEEEHPEDTT